MKSGSGTWGPPNLVVTNGNRPSCLGTRDFWRGEGSNPTVMQINILEAKNRLSQLHKSAQAGLQVIIAKRGVPAFRLVCALPAPPTREPAGPQQYRRC